MYLDLGSSVGEESSAMQETPDWFLGREDPLEKGYLPTPVSWASLVAQLGKNLPAMQET